MRVFVIALFAGALGLGVHAEEAPAAPDLTAAATAWIASLDDAQRAAGQMKFGADERFVWTYLPQDRPGLPLKKQSAEQQDKALAIVQAALSELGYTTVSTMRRLEIVLRDDFKESAEVRDPDRFFLIVFGEPGDKGVWGLRYEGHHVSLNLTLRDGAIISSTPQFLGANPHRVPMGPMEGTRALGVFEDLGKELLASLDEAQQALAILPGDPPADILTRFDSVATPPDAAQGIAYADLRPNQQAVLMKLLETAAGVQRPGVAAARMAKVQAAGLEALRFVWIGGAGPGQKHYYRAQGPTFVFEYDNTQNDANHSHTVWRDFAGDFGRDVLKEHYQAAHSAPGTLAAAQ